MTVFDVFYKQNLRNAQHILVMRNCLTYANALAGINDDRFAGKRATLLACIDREDDYFQISQGSKYTAQIEEADKRRDRAYSIINNVSAAFEDGYGPAEFVAPAKQIQEVLTKHKVNPRDQYDQQTGMVTECCQHLDTVADAIAVLSLTNVFAILKSANEEVNTYIMKRQTERADFSVGALHDARVATDAAFDSFMDYVSALSLVNPSPAISQFIKEWNSYVDHIRKMMLNVAAAPSKANATDTTEGGGEPAPTPEQTETPTPPSQGGSGTGSSINSPVEL